MEMSDQLHVPAALLARKEVLIPTEYKVVMTSVLLLLELNPRLSLHWMHWETNIFAWFQASATKEMRTAWASTRRVVVIPYWHFGTTYWPYLYGLRIQKILWFLTNRFSWTSGRNYHYSLSNSSKECNTQILFYYISSVILIFTVANN